MPHDYNPPCSGLEKNTTNIQTSRKFDALFSGNYLTAEETNIDLAEALFNCGQEKYAAGEYEQAISRYERLIADCPDIPFVSQAKARLVDARVAALKQAQTGELAPPQETGWTTAGKAAVVISNDSPERLEFLLSGPSSQAFTMEACSECETYFLAPVYCPEKGPASRSAWSPAPTRWLYERSMIAASHPGRAHGNCRTDGNISIAS